MEYECGYAIPGITNAWHTFPAVDYTTYYKTLV